MGLSEHIFCQCVGIRTSEVLMITWATNDKREESKVTGVPESGEGMGTLGLTERRRAVSIAMR